jgi:hypothetical protein
VGVCLASRQQTAELVHVQPKASAGVRTDVIAVHDEPLAAQCFSEYREIAPKHSTRAARLELRPQQRGQGLAGVAPARQREVGNEGYVLARVKLERPTIALETRLTKQEQLQARH